MHPYMIKLCKFSIKRSDDMPYTVKCKKCGNEYESGANRSGVCPNCRLTRSQITTRSREKIYDNVRFYVPKGDREKLKTFAAEHGMSLNEFVNKAVYKMAQEIYEEDQKHQEDKTDTED